MKGIYLTFGERYEDMIDHRSSEKKFRTEQDSNLWCKLLRRSLFPRGPCNMPCARSHVARLNVS